MSGTPNQVGMSDAIRARFSDLRRLGHGAEGGTWVARDGAGRQVVLKHVPAARRSTVARAFEVLREVSSPHLPAALELLADADVGGIWLVTGYVEGEPIGAGPVPLEQALAEALGVAHALAAIHGLGTHHADVSANNVLVTPTRGVVLTDLGQLGSLGCGTPGFLAPEVLRGGGGAAADWFGLGSLLCLRLLGQVPWRRPERLLELAAASRDLARAGVRQRLHALAEAAEVELPTSLRLVLERLLDPDPSDRITDPRLVVARLRQLHRASSTGELTRASAPWWLPSHWRYIAGEDPAASIEAAIASVRGGGCRLVAIAGPDASGRGRVVEEIVQRMQLADTREGESSGRARISDPLGLAGELAGAGSSRPPAAETWIDAWLAGEAPSIAPIRGFVQPPEWPVRLRESVELRAAVLRAGADLGTAVLILPVELELGRRLARAEPSSVRVIELRAWSREQVLECLRSVVEDDDGRLGGWAAALHEATGGWPARVIRAIEAVARSGFDDLEPDRAVVERALVAADSEPRIDPALARALLDRCWGVSAEPGQAPLPDSLVDAIGRAPLASSVAAARLSLGEAVAALARTTLGHARELDRAIPLALALDADDADAIEAWFVARSTAELGSDLLAWLERGGIIRVGPRLRLRALRELIRHGEADRSLTMLQAIAQTGMPSPAERLEGVRAREQLGRSGEAIEQLDELLPQLHGLDRDRALGLRWRALVDAGRASEARLEAESWSRDRGASEHEPDWRRAVAWLWGGLAILYAGGDAQPWLERARAECRSESSEPTSTVAGLLARIEQLEANLAQVAGENQRARERYRAAAEWFAIAGEGLGRVLVEGSLAALALEAGEFDEALARGRRACRGFLARAQVQTLPAVLFNLVRALIAIGALDEGRRLLSLSEQLCAAAGEPSQLVRARLDRTAIELDLAPSTTTASRRAPLGERMVGCALALAQAGAAGEAIDAQVSAAALARIEGAPTLARLRLREASDRLNTLGASADPGVRLGVALETLAQAQTREQLEQARAGLSDLPGPVDLWAGGQRLLAWTYDRTLLGVLHRFGCVGDRSSQPVARRLITNLEELMTKAPTLDRRALRHSLLSEAGEAGPLRELVRELEADDHEPIHRPAPRAETLEEAPAWAAESARASAEPASARLQRLFKIFRRLAREDELPRLLEQVVEAMMELTDAERGAVVLGRGSEQISVAREFANAGEAVDFSRSVIERVLAEGEPVLSVDATADDRFDGSRSISHLNLRSVLAVPLVFRGELLGAAYVDHRLRRGNFDADDLAHMEDFADLAALAVAHARALAEVRAQKAELEQQKSELAGLLERSSVEVANLREVVRESPARRSYRGMIGSSAKMQQVFRLIDRLADSDVPVVIHGESGTGKELVARAIHDAGPRRVGPFVAENCGAIPETLLESVLFGHARGAFTGAQLARPGLFEAAEGGTIFLDEIGETSPAMQTKLLRVLQGGEVRRIGENKSRTIDVRVIAASNRSLEQMVEQGTFRQDLYYRINVVKLELPSLRERREDIPALIDHFLTRGHDGRDGPALELAAATLRKLTSHPWPGNVRELENEVQRWLALCEVRVMPEDLSPAIGAATADVGDPDDLALRPRVDRLERELIARAMQRTGGNQTQAAALLGLSRFGLQKKLKRLDSDDG
jgi:transcriptional regulator with GAF, ATPase, and Fis domain